ncbi:hypothetical protein BD309DRAFT_958481 [Dichomitus squalens]|uniref:Uncharacterized protein n=1 Tax=Dichomitus squalens TaxID=114155 RepID=A0A4Q9PX19_9APHY|nr:hypothetical protein BD309DRAFT_958481 [Dichomitus squalens]TBU59247.1 hypothetical protein BD310DRAFT_925588 [Dichomitus squalens]
MIDASQSRSHSSALAAAAHGGSCWRCWGPPSFHIASLPKLETSIAKLFDPCSLALCGALSLRAARSAVRHTRYYEEPVCVYDIADCTPPTTKSPRGPLVLTGSEARMAGRARASSPSDVIDSSQTRWRPGSCWRLSGPTAWPVSVPLRTPSPRRQGCRLQRTRSLLTACYD